MAYIDSKSHILSCENVMNGTVNACTVFPREILKRAIQLDCEGIIISHCHPSGATTPSKEDINLTKRLVDIFQPIGINVHDHIIVAGKDYLSMAERDTINFGCPCKTANYKKINMGKVDEKVNLEEELEL